jgi:hypothetical protein
MAYPLKLFELISLPIIHDKYSYDAPHCVAFSILMLLPFIIGIGIYHPEHFIFTTVIITLSLALIQSDFPQIAQLHPKILSCSYLYRRSAHGKSLK